MTNIKDVLQQTFKNVFNNVLKHYDRHNTKYNYESIESIIKFELVNNIAKKINIKMLDELNLIKKNVTRVINAIHDDEIKQEYTIDKKIQVIDKFQIIVDQSRIIQHNKLASISFEDEFNESLKQIFRSDYVYNPDLRQDLKRYFNNFELVLRQFIQQQYTSLITTSYEQMKSDMEQLKHHLENQLDSNLVQEDNVSKQIDDTVDEVKEERKLKFIQAREEQRKKDSIERERQLNARTEVTMIDNNYSVELTSRRR